MKMSAYVCVLCICSVQSLSRVLLFSTPWIAARQASLSITNSLSSLKLMSIHYAIQPSHPLSSLLFYLPPIAPSIRVFSNESTLRMRWPKYWSFSFSISPSNEHPGLISFRMDWFPVCRGVKKKLLMRELDDFPFESERRNGYGWIDLG